MVFVVVLGLSLMMGSVKIDPWGAIKYILNFRQDGTSAFSPLEITIIFSLRLPRVIFAGIIGAAMALVGTVFQALLAPHMMHMLFGADHRMLVARIGSLWRLIYGCGGQHCPHHSRPCRTSRRGHYRPLRHAIFYLPAAEKNRQFCIDRQGLRRYTSDLSYMRRLS